MLTSAIRRAVLQVTDGQGKELQARTLVADAHALSVLRAEWMRMEAEGWVLDGKIDEAGFRVTKGAEQRIVSITAPAADIAGGPANQTR